MQLGIYLGVFSGVGLSEHTHAVREGHGRVADLGFGLRSKSILRSGAIYASIRLKNHVVVKDGRLWRGVHCLGLDLRLCWGGSVRTTMSTRVVSPSRSCRS